ncbi:unnamed protein product [Adineta ricciae]|uniref:Uncharacterized protein n=1 Tax=Adineta ricciae TaxID=249248 RepID=A0A815WKY0_ADIRI|nr:unnamed protein product [Adineta ricciae]CAF1550353.1 unnamed protein product [Adineta ricciae]
MIQYNTTLSKSDRREQLVAQLSVLPTFKPVNEFVVYHIYDTTSESLLHYLISMARTTTRYTIDTEHDCFTNEAALIQIEFIKQKSIVLLIETCYLPEPTSVTFWLIQSLFAAILNPVNLVYAWGDAVHELTRFLHYDLFSWTVLQRMGTINMQRAFKAWYNRVFVHDCGLHPHETDSTLCTCEHRPVKDKNYQWSLQKAIAYTFQEYLDKRRTRSKWHRCLRSRNETEQELCKELVLYAVNDCLSVTKLRMLVEFNWTKEQLDRYNRNK